MQLTVTIENGPQPEMSGKTWCCGTEGGTLGRGPDCDLVLPDPKRYTSSVHAVIAFDQGAFTLTDQSTNGTYHNSPRTLIGKNRSVSLDHGDRVFIGDFVLRVDFEDAVPDAQPRPAAEEATSQFGADAPSGDASVGRDEDGGAERGSWDADDFSLPWDGSGTDPDGRGEAAGDDEQQSFSQSPEREYFAAPSATPSGGDAIPDDWDDFLTGFHDVGPGNAPEADDSAAGASAARSSDDSGPASAHAPARDAFDEADEASDQSQPFSDAEPDAEDRFEPPPERPEPAAPEGNPPAAPSPEAPAEPVPETPAGPPPQPAPARRSEPQPPPAAASTPAGGPPVDDETREILRVVTEGLMTLLQGRSEIKNEFRISQTRFGQAENNPLKFSPNPEEALSRILGQEKSPGFLTGSRAFESAFDDIQAHQLAILSAVQRAIESAVSQFDPAELENKLQRISPASARMPGLKAVKCWNLFTMHYEEVAGKTRDDARKMFLNEFAEAYEEACRAVAEGKRRDRNPDQDPAGIKNPS